MKIFTIRPLGELHKTGQATEDCKKNSKGCNNVFKSVIDFLTAPENSMSLGTDTAITQLCLVIDTCK